jgi:hypothetical protein
VEAASESFELAVEHLVEVSDCGEELDVIRCEFVGASLFSMVHGVDRCLVVLD